MASVKYAISAYVADGTTTDYLITWDYLDEDHIAVYVDGTSNADPTASHTFSKLNDTTLRITDELGNAIVAGAEIEIRRETPLTTRAITFADGSALLASDLNKNSDYLLYSMQEVLDTVDAAAQDGALAAQVATEGFRDEAEAFKDTTAGYLATVQSDATDADNHRIAAAASEAASAASEAAAATSELNAATSEANSATSEAASAVSAAAALASETAAATSEANANTSEVAAQTAQTAAETAQTAAESAQTAAESALQTFEDSYLGSYAADPTTDNNGDPLVSGQIYFSTTLNILRVYSGSAWTDAGSAVNGTAERHNYIATAGQTTFAADFDSGLVDVYVNGVKLTPSVDFTEAATLDSITLTTAASVNDNVDIIAYGAFLVSNAYTRGEADGRFVSNLGDDIDGPLNFGGVATGPKQTIKQNRMGYSSSYSVLQLGETASGNLVSLFVDPSTNTSGQFNGNGKELLVPHNFKVITTDSANTNYKEAIELDEGIVSMPSQPALFITGSYGAYTGNANDIVPFNYVKAGDNTNGAFDTSTSIYTAPSAGMYQVSLYGLIQTATNWELRIYFNGSTYARFYTQGDRMISGTCLLDMQAGDQFYAYTNVPIYLHPTDTYSGLTIIKVA